MSDAVKVDVLYGYVEIIQTMKMDKGDLVLGGYSKHYDKDGALLKTTKDEECVRMRL